jgi:hypothetical protein
LRDVKAAGAAQAQTRVASTLHEGTIEMEERNGKTRTFTEEIELAGAELVERIKALLAEGNVRQLRLKASDGDIVLETPLTIGVVAGGAVALAAPWLAILGAIAALVTHVKVEIVREEADDGSDGASDGNDGGEDGRTA